MNEQAKPATVGDDVSVELSRRRTRLQRSIFPPHRPADVVQSCRLQHVESAVDPALFRLGPFANTRDAAVVDVRYAEAGQGPYGSHGGE